MIEDDLVSISVKYKIEFSWSFVLGKFKVFLLR